MATNYVYSGERVNTTNGTGSTLSSGGVILCGDEIRVALVSIANGASGACARRGVFTLACLSTDTPSDGTQLYWDNGNSRCTTTAGANKKAGKCIGGKAGGVATCNVAINENA